MKIRCNICSERPIIELPEPGKDKSIHCSRCNKKMAISLYNYKKKIFWWYILDTEFNEILGMIPVSIISS